MKTFLFLLLLNGLSLVPLQARVGAYFVRGAEQIPVEKNSLSEWCDWMTMGDPNGQRKTPQDLLGIFYERLVARNMNLQELPPQPISLKNNLKVGKYYIFFADEAFFRSYPWLVMDRSGHIVYAFNFWYGGGTVLPRIIAVWQGIGVDNTPAPDNMEMHEQGGESWIYHVDKKQGFRHLRSYVNGKVAVVCDSTGGAYCFDWPLEYETPTIRQDDLVPVLREFVNVQMGRSRAVEAEAEILSLLPKAKKLVYDYKRRTISYPNPPPPPQAPASGVIPAFEQSWKALAEKLHFPDASRYRITEESGPHPQRMTHCRFEWLKKCGVACMLRKWERSASVAYRCLLGEEDPTAVYVAVAQCGTRAFALEALARMRLWQARLEEKDGKYPVEPDPAMVAVRTNTSDRLVGDYALYLKGILDQFGRATRQGMYGAVFFVRGTTAVCVIAEDPRRDMLGVARRIDRELKKMYALGPEKREPKKWTPDADLEEEFNNYMKSKGLNPETGEKL